jgi:hypothetical protein
MQPQARLFSRLTVLTRILLSNSAQFELEMAARVLPGWAVARDQLTGGNSGGVGFRRRHASP